MVTATEEKKAEAKASIHERKGLGPMDIYKIEEVFHKDAGKKAHKDLTKLVDKFFNEHIEEEGARQGHLKKGISADEATDAFLELLGKYHFGAREYKEHIAQGNEEFIKQELARVYGVERRQLKSALKRGGYEGRDQFYQAHRTPMLEQSTEVKRKDAQAALEEYRTDEDTKDELVEHIQKRVGKDKQLTKTFRDSAPLEHLIPVISAYMEDSDAIAKIKKDRRTSLPLSDVRAGDADVYQVFEHGDKYMVTRHDQIENIDDKHRLTGKKRKVKYNAAKNPSPN